MNALVGRERELEALRDGLRDRAGTALLVVEGPEGIGKTRLLEAVAAEARRGGARVLAARASELERELPFGVMRRLLEAPGELRGAAALAAPALTPDPRPGAPFAVLHGLYWLIAGLAERAPLVLCVDDLHWADAPSLRALAYLLARIDGVDAQLCAALRPDEPGTDAELIRAVVRAAPQRTVRPGPLDPAAAAALVRASAPAAEDAFCEACRAAAAGNPLLLGELVRALVEAGVPPTAAHAGEVAGVVPGGVAGAVRRRLARVGPDAPQVARALAVLGDDADPAHVGALAGVADAHGVLDALARAGVLSRARPPAFAHPLVRVAAGADAPAALHTAAARVLAGAGATPERIVPHLLEAPPAGDPWVAETLAAAAAVSRGAPDVAATLLRRALAEPPPPDRRAALLLAAGGVEAQAGDPRALAHLQAAVAAAPDAASRVDALLALTGVLGVAGELRHGIAVLQAELDGIREPELRLRLQAELVNLARLDVSTRPLALAVLARLAPGTLEPGPVGSVLLANHATEAVGRGEDRASAIALAERALAGGWLLEAPILYGLAANSLALAGRFAHAVAAWDDFIAHAGRRGDIPLLAFGHAFRACARWRAGALVDAVADAEVALEAGPAHGFALAGGFAVAFAVEALILRGELAEARATLARAPAGGEQLQDALLLAARGRLHLAEERHGQALEELRAVGVLLERWEVPNAVLAPWRADAALALAALGEAGEAQALAAHDVAAAERWGDPWLLGPALRAQALVGPTDERRARLERSEAVLRGSEAPLEHARTLLALGGRVALREALHLAERCAAPALVAEARAALVRAGGRPRRAAATGRAALTATEERVARLAAAGPSNREIAQSLFVTEKTVEAHLSRAYRKLGVRSRAELAAALGEAAGL